MKKDVKPLHNRKKLGALSGVFIPTFLSIIGVILFLRLGYIVGSAGMIGSIAIILLAASVTLCTGLSLSSITTNIRIGSGAAYSLIAKTLGIEVGGSIGIPLYFAMVFSVALYLLGFAEAWNYVFPLHSFIVVTLLSFAFLFILTVISTHVALRVQSIVFLFVLASLASLYMGGDWNNIESNMVIGDFSGTSFWMLFALFFPAVTGLMAGIGLSGELQDPKKQIPRGVLSSLVITTIIYIATAIWLSSSADSDTLKSNNLIMVELSAYGPLVLLGILSATLSSALTTFVAAPRLLQAIADNSIIPFSTFFAQMKNGEARNAIFFTSGIIIVALILGSLETIAPLLTVFFLISYAMINTVVFIEQSLGLPSFRPTFKVPRLVPLYGALSSIAIMFFMSPIAGIIALLFLLGVYLSLVKKKLVQKEGDVRSGLFRSLAEWAAKKVQMLPESKSHTWKANILLPALHASTIIGNFPIIKALTFPHGTMTVLGMRIKKTKTEPLELQGKGRDNTAMNSDELRELIDNFAREGIFTSSSVVDADDYSKGIATTVEAINSQVFHPNILFLPYKAGQLSIHALKRIGKACEENNIGAVFLDKDEEIGFGSEKSIHIWISPDILQNDIYEERPYDLALLIAYKLLCNWKGKMHIWMCIDKERSTEARGYLKKLLYESRLPLDTTINTPTGSFLRNIEKSPKGDIHIIPFYSSHMATLSKMKKIQGRSLLFVSDSGKEDIMS